MTAARRRRRPVNESPAVSPSERQAILLREFRRDLTFWIQTHPRTALRIMRIIEEVVADPLGGGIGKPEPLQHDMAGTWSRRITDEHRMVYRIRGTAIIFALARWHYDRR
ncbi:MAG TPA: Txe/YoeB family addiction module toxin [Longimicrobium sp.]|nr:Txe/YoeB family addiction module toxin [Longimicrobium sp.]